MRRSIIFNHLILSIQRGNWVFFTYLHSHVNLVLKCGQNYIKVNLFICLTSFILLPLSRELKSQIAFQLFPMHYHHEGLGDGHLIELLTAVLSTKFDSKHDRRFYTWILGDNVDDSASEFPQRSSTSETDDVSCYFEV